jgi:hypothetical protein
METTVRKLLTFLIALGAIASGVCSPVSAQLGGGLMFPGPGPGRGGGGGRTCTDDTASTNFLARTSGLTNATKDAYCNFIKTMETNSLITGNLSGADSCGAPFDAIYFPATDNSATSLLNLCGTSFSLVNHGTTFTVGSGYVGAASSYIDTQFDPTAGTNFTTASASGWIWTTTNFSVSTDYGAAFSTASNNGTTRLYPQFSDGNFYMDMTGSMAGGSYGSGHFFGASRSSTIAASAYVNTAQSSGLSVSSSNPTGTTLILAADSSGGLNHFTGNIAFAAIGGNLTSTQEANFYAAVHTYLQTVAGVP